MGYSMRKNKTYHRKKTVLLWVLCMGMMVGLAGRLVYLCVFRSVYYSEKADAFKTVSSLTDLKASLWCVKVTEEGSGKEPIYDFFNKATGETLAVSDLDASAIKAGTFATTDSLTVG